jgi:diguanylate cyclase
VRQFKDDNLVQEVANIFSDNDIQPGDIEFELTETAFADNIELVSLCMRPLSFFGINFSLDGFGSGNTSLLHLQRLPISAVKIDLGFVQELHRSHTDKRLVSAMIMLAHNLGKLVIAEGVQTLEQKNWLKSLNCDQMQGAFFSKPKSIEELILWLQEGVADQYSMLN